MKYEPFQAPSCDWLDEPGLAHLVEKLDGTSPLGAIDRTRLSDDAIKQAIEKGRRLRARAFRDAFAATLRLVPRAIRFLRRTWRDLADERKALRELSALDDHLLRDIGIERIDVRSVVKSGIAARSGACQGRRVKGNVFSWEQAIASSTNTIVAKRINIMLTREATQHHASILLIAIVTVFILVLCVNSLDIPVRHHMTAAPITVPVPPSQQKGFLQ